MKLYSSDDVHLNENMTEIKYFIIKLVLLSKICSEVSILNKGWSHLTFLAAFIDT